MADSAPSNHHKQYPVLPWFSNQDAYGFDFGELEQAIVLPAVHPKEDDDGKALFAESRPAATLDMFPLRTHQNPRESSKSGDSTDSASSALNNLSDKRQELEDMKPSSSQAPVLPEKRKSTASTSEKPLDAKTLRRLAQNREAARKSRLRKKAYVQQLESSRMKLTQLEQDLQRARSQVQFDDDQLISLTWGATDSLDFEQGMFFAPTGGNISSGNAERRRIDLRHAHQVFDEMSQRDFSVIAGAAMFDVEYARWLEEDNRQMTDLRSGMEADLLEADLRAILDSYITHYDEIFRLKTIAAKTDVFHLITGMWTTPAERCFLWMGGFRPSDLIKILTNQLSSLSDQQLVFIYGLQQSSQQAEDALSQGLDQLQQSLVDTVAGGCLADGFEALNMALGKLANLEGFVRQADNLRQQTIHQLRRNLTVRQAATCFIVIGEYYSRLRALSSLWASRPREAIIGKEFLSEDLSHFPNF